MCLVQIVEQMGVGAALKTYYRMQFLTLCLVKIISDVNVDPLHENSQTRQPIFHVTKQLRL